MLLSSLDKLESVLEKYKGNLTREQIKELATVLELYKDGIIPIGVVRRALNLEISEAQDLMIFLESVNILKSKFKVYCPNKSECITENLYDYIKEIPRNHCDKCDDECVYLENIVVVFKVV